MKWWWIAGVAALVLAGTANADETTKRAGLADGEVRHSGTVVSVDPRGGRLTMHEMVAWNGPGTGIVERSVRLTPDTSMQIVRRDEDADRSAMTGFQESRIALREIRRGDFVTVTLRRDSSVAVSLEVVRPGER